MTTESSSYEVKMIPTSQITESPMNPRKTFLDVDGLVDDVKKRGILQPVLVRPNGGKGYELVFGARRYRAAKAAKLEAVPAMVRTLLDDEALELMIVENCKRTDIHPLEEADGYRQLHEKHGHQVEDIAAKVGKSKAYVYARMKLCELAAPARKAFLGGQLTPSVALLVARVPPQLQEKAAHDLTHERDWNGKGRVLAEPLPFRQAAELIQREYMLRLDEAPFPKGDAELLPAAGPCTICPKRTGNQRELFSDVKSADVCTDPTCFKQKAEAQWERLKVTAQSEGHQVLSDAEGKKALPNGRLRYGNSELVDLAEPCYDDSRQRTYGTLLKKAPPVEKILARDEDGKVHELAKAKTVAKALKEAGHNFRSSSTRSSGRSAADKKRDARSKLQKKVARAAIAAISAKAATKSPDAGLWRLLVVLAEVALGSTPSKAVLGRWAIDPGRDRWEEKRSDKFLGLLKTVKESQARALLIELLLEDRIQFMGGWGEKYPASLTLASEYFGVNVAQLEKEAAASTTKPEPNTPAKKTARKK
jgi:ParB/RepB/Spo0J family partition protein